MAADMRQVDAVIQRRLASDVALIDQIAHYIISAGGKRIRPRLVLLFAERARLRRPRALRARRHGRVHPHRDAAARRRGRRIGAAPRPQTANAMFGNAASVLVGDFVYSRAFQMMVSVEPHARARGAGRRDQRDRRRRGAAADEHARPRPRGRRLPARDPLQDRQAVRGQRAPRRGARRGRRPTSRKPAPPTAARSAPRSSWSTTCSTTKARPNELGKNVGDDLREGKPTLPLLIAMERGTQAERELIRHAIEHGEVARLAEIVAIVRRPARSRRRAMPRAPKPTRHAHCSRSCRASPYRDALLDLWVRSVDRSS